MVTINKLAVSLFPCYTDCHGTSSSYQKALLVVDRVSSCFGCFSFVKKILFTVNVCCESIYISIQSELQKCMFLIQYKLQEVGTLCKM